MVFSPVTPSYHYSSTRYSSGARLKPCNLCITIIGMGFLTLGVIGVSYPMHHIVSYTFVGIGAMGALFCGTIFVSKAILSGFIKYHNRKNTNPYYLPPDDNFFYDIAPLEEDYLDELEKVIKERVGKDREFLTNEEFEDGRDYLPTELWLLVLKRLKNVKALAAISETSTFFYTLVYDKQGPLTKLPKYLKEERTRWHALMPGMLQSLFNYPELLPTIQSESAVFDSEDLSSHFEYKKSGVLKGEEGPRKFFLLLIKEKDRLGIEVRKVLTINMDQNGNWSTSGLGGIPFFIDRFQNSHVLWFKSLLKGETCDDPNPYYSYLNRPDMQITLWKSEEATPQ